MFSFGVLISYCLSLFLADSVYGTNVRASAAVYANFRIYIVLCVAFADSLDRADTRARAAGNAFLTDLMSHNDFLHYM